MKAFYFILLLLFVALSSNAQADASKRGCAFFGQDNDNTVSNNLPGNNNQTTVKSTPKKTKSLFGIASFYSKNLEGTETATGETFYHSGLTAASNFFKLNSWVRVTNILTGKSVIVRINDRMHPRMAAQGRVVDLTISAAKTIGLTILTGITKVKVDLVNKETIR